MLSRRASRPAICAPVTILAVTVALSSSNLNECSAGSEHKVHPLLSHQALEYAILAELLAIHLSENEFDSDRFGLDQRPKLQQSAGDVLHQLIRAAWWRDRDTSTRSSWTRT